MARLQETQQKMINKMSKMNFLRSKEKFPGLRVMPYK